MKSFLKTYVIETGKITTVLETERHIEAPNWSPDGLRLVVNGGGRLYNVPLSAPVLVEIDTHGLHNLNNDHGFSPDSATYALSDKTETGTSVIYLMPVAGGAPFRLTEQGYSYYHGWSPDGETVAYTAKRDEAFEVVTMPVGGGAERVLTTGFDHCDGPDYSPDGRWIWFNGERNGAVDLWRISPEGGEPERMTDDDRVNWFPHPSPCGRHVVYLAYPPGTRFHPADLEVELRLMPQDGGSPRVLVEMFGGQGTINVPSWSPDGRAFAFVEYARP